MTRRTALFALAILAMISWPALLGAQSNPPQKAAAIHVYEGPG